jgi:hypothetical protein
MFNDLSKSQTPRADAKATLDEAIETNISDGGIRAGLLLDRVPAPQNLTTRVAILNDVLQIPSPRALTGGKATINTITEALLTNSNGRGIRESDLPRLKSSGGGTPRIIVPILGGEEPRERINCVAVYKHDERVYHGTPFGNRTGKQSPDCTSDDGITGFGKLGGACCSCAMNQWGSAEGGIGKACHERQKLFLLYDDLMVPGVFSLSRMSKGPASQFFFGLAMQGIPYYGALISLTLETTQNAARVSYGRVALKFVRRLTPEEADIARQYHEFFKSLPGRVPTGPDAEEREPGDEEDQG